MRVLIFHQQAVMQHCYFVEVDNGGQFMRDGDDGVFGKFSPNDALD